MDKVRKEKFITRDEAITFVLERDISNDFGARMSSVKLSQALEDYVKRRGKGNDEILNKIIIYSVLQHIYECREFKGEQNGRQ